MGYSDIIEPLPPYVPPIEDASYEPESPVIFSDLYIFVLAPCKETG